VSVTKRGDKWLARWVVDGRHVGRTFDLKADAEEWETAQRRRAQLGAHAPAEPSRDTLKTWLDTWWDRRSLVWERSTRIHRGSIVDKWIVPYIGGVRMRDFGTAKVQDWRKDIRAAGASPHTCNQALRVLSAALGAAVEDRQLPANPCVGVRKLPVKREPVRPLTPAEVERIRLHMPTLRDVVMLGFLAYAGLRTEEVLALRWGEVGKRHVTVARAVVHGEEKGTKTGAFRTVELVDPLADDVALYRPKVTRPDDLMFPSGRGGFIDLDNWRRRVFGPAAVAAGLYTEKRGKDGELRKVPTVTPYDGRHAYASLLIHEGRSLLQVAAALGHSSGDTTLRHYAHVFDEARLASGVGMVEAITAARDDLARKGLHNPCTTGVVRRLRSVARG
jgi:integrase